MQGSVTVALNVDISALYLGNFADVDTFEGNYATENAADLLGTYGSTANPVWQDIVTLDSDSPTPYIDVDHDTGDGTLSYDTGGGAVTSKLDSFVEFNATLTYTDGTTATLVLDVIQLTNGDVFLIPWDDNTALGAKAIESVELTSVNSDGWAGFAQTSYDQVTFVCFTPGTLIATPGGESPVELLRPGDSVSTRDHGAEPVLWTARRRLRFPGAPETQKPVEFKPGSLGIGVPFRPLRLSPQHRVVLTGADVARICGAPEAFAPARTLEQAAGVRRMSGRRRVDYIALLLPRHEVILAEGAAVESFYPGVVGLKSLAPFSLLELRALLPGLRNGAGHGYGPMARPTLTGRQVRDVMQNRRNGSAQTQIAGGKVGFALS